MQCPRCGSSNTSLHSPSYFAHQGAGYTCMECERGGPDRGRFVVSGEDPAAQADSARWRGASAANRAAIVEGRQVFGVAIHDSVPQPDGTSLVWVALGPDQDLHRSTVSELAAASIGASTGFAVELGICNRCGAPELTATVGEEPRAHFTEFVHVCRACLVAAIAAIDAAKGGA